MEVIKTANLSKYYGKARGIVDVNLGVEEGEFFDFIGPNGAGKSTTIRCLLGLISPSSGSAEVLGKDVNREKEAILKDVGYLPSEAMFYRGMKVKDALKFSAELRKMDCSSEAKQLCERLELDVNRKIDELSFGNRKKLAIVCALQHRPKLIILDEPTSGLDPLMQKAFFDILRERNAQGATVLLSSHILSEIQRNCTRAAVIRDGRIIACNNVDELAKNNAKRVVLHGEADLSGLSGIRNLEQGDQASSFLYSGSMNSLLEALASGRVDDLSISEPDLEEVFMHFYEREGE